MTRRKFSGGRQTPIAASPEPTAEEKLTHMRGALAAQTDGEIDEEIRAEGEEPGAVEQRMLAAVQRLLNSKS